MSSAQFLNLKGEKIMSIARQRNIGAFLASLNALIANVITATGAAGTEQDGYWNNRKRKLSGVLVISYTAVLGQDETLSIAANLQDATDAAGAGAADYGDAFADAIVATGGAGGSTEIGTVEIDVDLSSANGWVRGQVTPTLSAGTVDTVAISAVLVLSGADEYPV